MLNLFIRTEATDDYDDFLRSGIIFHQESKILLAEKFVNVEFLLPFPKYNFEWKAEIAKLLSKLGDKWKIPSASCPLDSSLPFNSTKDAFSVDWLGKKINEEVTLVQRETDLIRNETAKLLYKPQEKSNRVRSDDGSALATIAGVGFFGPGVLLAGIGGSCGFLGTFGSCKDKSKANA